VSRVRMQISVSLDGFVAGPDQSLDNPLGINGERLHEWVFPLAVWRRMHGREGGAVNASNAVVEEAFANVGATIMGRNMFGGGPGPWKGDWKGWWGDDPPFHTPVFVLTHHARDPLVMNGGTTFYFVTDGVASALDRAREAAGGKDVQVGGGADAARQFLAGHLLDEIEIHLVPLLLGSGARLLDNLPTDLQLDPIRTIGAPGVTHLKYRVVK